MYRVFSTNKQLRMEHSTWACQVVYSGMLRDCLDYLLDHISEVDDLWLTEVD